MKPFVQAEIWLKASPEAIWKVLTDPDFTEKYMFGCRVSTDWQPGSTVDWIGQAEGKSTTYVTGRVLKYIPYSTLSYTVIDPFATYPLTEENHLTVTHTISEGEEGTKLTVSQGDYTKVADGENRYGHGADEGWLQLLNTIGAIAQAL